jgi:hypothetical protein
MNTLARRHLFQRRSTVPLLVLTLCQCGGDTGTRLTEEQDACAESGGCTIRGSVTIDGSPAGGIDVSISRILNTTLYSHRRRLSIEHTIPHNRDHSRCRCREYDSDS